MALFQVQFYKIVKMHSLKIFDSKLSLSILPIIDRFTIKTL